MIGGGDIIASVSKKSNSKHPLLLVLGQTMSKLLREKPFYDKNYRAPCFIHPKYDTNMLCKLSLPALSGRVKHGMMETPSSSKVCILAPRSS